MKENGWIKLHRQILNNPIIKKPNYLSLWVILLLKANHEQNSFIWNKKKQTCNRGQFITGRNQLSLESGISAGTVENILNYLESEHQIEQQKTSKFRLITIINYNKYQEVKQENEQQNDSRMTTELQQNDTNKNNKKDKNERTISKDIEQCYGREDINNLLKDFEEIMGFKSSSSKDRIFATHLLRNFTTEQLKAMLTYCSTDSYAPRVGSLEKLWFKRGDIIAGLKTRQNKMPTNLDNIK